MEQLPADILFGNGLSLHKLFKLLQIFMREKGYADSLSAIAAGAAGFLIISFQTLRYVIMYHKPHIGIVNAHSECNRGHDHVDALHEKVVLRLRSCGRVEAGMIGRRLYLVSQQHGRKFFHRLARQAVYNAALARMLLDEFDDLPVYIVRFLPYFVVEVRPIE